MQNKMLYNYFSYSKVDNFFLILIYLIPPLILTGPFLPDLFLSILSLSFLIYIFVKKNFYLLNLRFSKFFLLFYLYLIFSSFLSSDILYSLRDSLFYIRYLFFTLAIFYLAKKFIFFPINFGYILLFCITFLAFDIVVESLFGYNIFGWKELNGYRVSSVFGDELIVGSVLQRLSIICICLFISFYKLDLKKYFIYFSFLLLLSTIVYLTGERVAFFNMLIFICLFALIIFRLSFMTIAPFLLIYPIIIIINKLFPYVNHRMNTLLEMQLSQTSYPFLPYTLSHEYIYTSALKMFFDNFLFGVGPNLFSVKCSISKYFVEFGCSTHAHNYYIHLLAETGIIGFLFLFLFFLFTAIKILFKLFSNYNLFNLKIISTSATIFYFFYFIEFFPLKPSGNFFANHLNIMIYIPMGFLLYFHYKSEDS